jgi:predicted N-acetyltransferase YhbS
MPEDEEELLLLGHDTWGKGISKETFVAQAIRERDHQRGVRFLLEEGNGDKVSKLSVIRFFRGCVGLCSIATRPDKRRLGYGTVLVRAVMELLRFEDPETRFLLFSEVDPDMYERQGFRVLPEPLQRFRPSLAMATGEAALTEVEAACLQEYF